MSEKSSNFEVQNKRLIDDSLSSSQDIDDDCERQQKLQVRIYQKLVLALAVVSTLMCVIVLVSAFYLFAQRTQEDTIFLHNKAIACIDCQKLVQDPYNSLASDPLLDTLKISYIDGVEKCCAYDSHEFSALLELTMRRQRVDTETIQSFNESNFSFSPAFAHRRLFPPKNPLPEVNYRKRVPIITKKPLTVLFQHENISSDPLLDVKKGVDVLKDGLQIHYSGLYYVYTSIHFRPESAYPCKNFTYQTWSFYVNKLSPNNPEGTGCLLKSSHTCCDECTMDEETKYTGGVFHLKGGDIIRVSIEAHGLIYFRSQSSFAGLMMLGSGNS